MSAATPLAMQARDLRVALGGRPVLHGVDLDIAPGQWTCVVGPNGAGKSTLLKALAGLLPAQGQVQWQGRDWQALPRRERARLLSWLGQGEAASLDLRVYDVASFLRSLPGPEDCDGGFRKQRSKSSLAKLLNGEAIGSG